MRSSLLIAAALLAIATAARADVEQARVRRAQEDAVVIERANGDRLRLDLRQGCTWAPGLQGRTVLVYSPTGVIGPESRILVPEYDVTCRVWAADSVGHVKPEVAPAPPDQALGAVRDALELMGFPCGPRAPRWNEDAAQAFARFRESRRLDSSASGVRRALTSLAIEVLRGRQATGTAMRISQLIADNATLLTDYLTGDARGACLPATFVRSRTDDGTQLTLGDGTIWQLAQDARDVTAGWSTDDAVMACAGRLINARTGEMVRTTRLR